MSLSRSPSMGVHIITAPRLARARFAERRRCEPNADGNCPSPRSPHVLSDASLDELRCEWRRLYRSEPPRFSRDLLIRGVGYRLQEIQHGGLGKSTRRAEDSCEDVPD